MIGDYFKPQVVAPYGLLDLQGKKVVSRSGRIVSFQKFPGPLLKSPEAALVPALTDWLEKETDRSHVWSLAEMSQDWRHKELLESSIGHFANKTFQKDLLKEYENFDSAHKDEIKFYAGVLALAHEMACDTVRSGLSKSPYTFHTKMYTRGPSRTTSFYIPQNHIAFLYGWTLNNDLIPVSLLTELGEFTFLPEPPNDPERIRSLNNLWHEKFLIKMISFKVPKCDDRTFKELGLDKPYGILKNSNFHPDLMTIKLKGNDRSSERWMQMKDFAYLLWQLKDL
jgi:hypothetical protein